MAALGLAAGGTAGPLLATELGGLRAAGWPVAALTAGSALAAPLMAARSSRSNRLAGLRAGHAAAALGAVVSVLAAFLGSLALLLVGAVALGAGTTAVFLARYAAAALLPPSHLTRAMSSVLTATAVGATASPLMLGPTAALATAVGLPPAAGFYVLAAVTSASAAALIPADRRLADARVVGSAPASPAQRGTLVGVDRRAALIAVGALALTNVLMVGVMSVAPVHLIHLGASETVVGLVVAVHVAAMFGPSPRPDG